MFFKPSFEAHYPIIYTRDPLRLGVSTRIIPTLHQPTMANKKDGMFPSPVGYLRDHYRIHPANLIDSL